MNALTDASAGRWFVVLERENLDALLQERQLIRSNREQFLGTDGKPLPPVSGLYNAGLIIGGGIVGYDSNVVTGGAGARYLGIGADAQYRMDQVSVYLRATAVTTGEVMVSVVATKTIYSVGVDADVFRYVSSDRILEGEAGFTRNEPRELAVKQAIEKAVFALVMEGVQKDYWEFADAAAGGKLLQGYLSEKVDLGLLPASALLPPPALAAAASETMAPVGIVQPSEETLKRPAQTAAPAAAVNPMLPAAMSAVTKEPATPATPPPTSRAATVPAEMTAPVAAMPAPIEAPVTTSDQAPSAPKDSNTNEAAAAVTPAPVQHAQLNTERAEAPNGASGQ